MRGGIPCPRCQREESSVIDSRYSPLLKAVRRRRECSGCGQRFTTHEALRRSPDPPQPPPPPVTGQTLKDYREARQWTYWHLADAIGVTERTVRDWERGKGRPKGKTLARFRRLLDDSAH
jgi:DNA-binding XRE family transcriptional regulator